MNEPSDKPADKTNAEIFAAGAIPPSVLAEEEKEHAPPIAGQAVYEPDNAFTKVVRSLKHLVNERFNLNEDKADELQIIEEIRKNVDFRGANLWVLIFAILVASIGLNVNSTAVVIGAMLISPLMGPIMGVGLGVGISDLPLITRSIKNLGVAAGISVLASTFYFLITPLDEAQSELLARTTPTIWDVLIATFGGLAGIIAYSRKERGNAIPGVAIATALMPPLCTAGYGLASGNFVYFFGAFYLFMINSVFISLSTTMIVRLMKYPKVNFVDPRREKIVSRWVTFFAIITIIPSIVIAYNVVTHSFFERRARNFITEELTFKEAQLISKDIEYTREARKIEVTFFGAPIDTHLIAHARNKMPDYDLTRTKLIVHQGYTPESNSVDMQTIQLLNQNLKTGIIEDLYNRNEAALRNKDEKIKLLEDELTRIQKDKIPVADIYKELKTQHPNITRFAALPCVVFNAEKGRQDTMLLAYASYQRKPKKDELARLSNWLKVRTNADSVKVVVE